MESPPPSADSSSRGPDDRVPTAPPAESSFEAALKQTSSSFTSPETAQPAGGSSSSSSGIGASAVSPTVASHDPEALPPQRRRTSSFEYSDDGTSQYDSLKLVPSGTNPLSPLFLDLIHAKIREAERQLHFAILASRARDRHDASKRCSCAMAELDYVRQKVLLPPPIRLLEARVLKASAMTGYLNSYADGVLGAKQAESLIQRAFQVLQELVDWAEIKRRHDSVELLEEFLPMIYFNDNIANDPALEAVAGGGRNKEDGGVDFVEVIVLWYQMLIDYGRITFRKAEAKEYDLSRKIKVENYANAAKLLLVGVQGLEEIGQELALESPRSISKNAISDPELATYIKSAMDGMEKITYKMVENWKQDEFLENIQASCPKLRLEKLQIMVLQARQKINDKKEEAKRRQEEPMRLSVRRDSTDVKIPAPNDEYVGGDPHYDDGEDSGSSEEEVGGDNLKAPKSKDKGKGKAIDEPPSPAFSMPSEPIKLDKGKGKAEPADSATTDDNGLPSYFDSEGARTGGARGEKEDDWVMVPGYVSS